MISNVSGNNLPIGTSCITSTSSVGGSNSSTIFQGDEQAVEAKAKAKEDLEARVTKLLDLKDNFLKASVVEQNGKVYLKLSRAQNDKVRSDERHDFSMSAIKDKLGIKDGIIKQNNNLKDITGRDLYEESGSATLERGKSIMIPLSELGQDFSWYQFGRKDLSDYVEKYMNAR